MLRVALSALLCAVAVMAAAATTTTTTATTTTFSPFEMRMRGTLSMAETWAAYVQWHNDVLYNTHIPCGEKRMIVFSSTAGIGDSTNAFIDALTMAMKRGRLLFVDAYATHPFYTGVADVGFTIEWSERARLARDGLLCLPTEVSKLRGDRATGELLDVSTPPMSTDALGRTEPQILFIHQSMTAKHWFYRHKAVDIAGDGPMDDGSGTQRPLRFDSPSMQDYIRNAVLRPSTDVRTQMLPLVMQLRGTEDDEAARAAWTSATDINTVLGADADKSDQRDTADARPFVLAVVLRTGKGGGHADWKQFLDIDDAHDELRFVHCARRYVQQQRERQPHRRVRILLLVDHADVAADVRALLSNVKHYRTAADAADADVDVRVVFHDDERGEILHSGELHNHSPTEKLRSLHKSFADLFLLAHADAALRTSSSLFGNVGMQRASRFATHQQRTYYRPVPQFELSKTGCGGYPRCATPLYPTFCDGDPAHGDGDFSMSALLMELAMVRQVRAAAGSAAGTGSAAPGAEKLPHKHEL